MATLMGMINRLLPFATPGTPVIQDLIHLGALCLLLYYGPKIQDRWQQRSHGTVEDQPLEAHIQENLNGHAAVNEVDNELGDQDQAAFEDEVDRQDDGSDNEDFRAFQQQQQQQQQQQDVPIAGPANAAESSNQRNVGAKKAKSLARKDQRRAYHEFQRAQGEAQRARDAEGAAQREAAQAAERERRRAAEAKLEAKKAKEREEKKEAERKEREDGFVRRETAVKIVKQDLELRRKSNLFEVARQVGGDADEIWVEKLLKASGLLGMNSSTRTLTFLTSTGWVVKVQEEDMMRLYELAIQENMGDESGKIDHKEIGKLLENVME